MNSPDTLTDTGLGTAYEREAIYRLFDRWLLPLGVKDACEGPIDGMAGIAGLHLAGLANAGAKVTVELPWERGLERVRAVYEHLGLAKNLETRVRSADEPRAPRHELMLTYNALCIVPDWEAYLERVALRATRYLVVSVTNPSSWGTWIRRGLRRFEREAKLELFDHPSCRADVLERQLKRFGRIVDHTHLDSPWWPDLFVDTGETLAGSTLRRLPGLDRLAAPKPSFLYGPDCYPFFDGHPERAAFLASMKKHPVFDGRGEVLGTLFGHHHAYLVEVRPSAAAARAR